MTCFFHFNEPLLTMTDATISETVETSFDVAIIIGQVLWRLRDDLSRDLPDERW